MTDFLDGLRTPSQIAEQISNVTGVPVAGRTVWEKAKRLGIAKKMGRDMFIHVDDIPKLLTDERRTEFEAQQQAASDRRLRDSLAKLTGKKPARPAR